MYNSALYNTAPYNGLFQQVGAGVPDEIEFDGFSLQNSNIIVSTLTEDSTPIRDLDVREIPRDDGSVVLTSFWRRKVITMAGHCMTNTACELDTLLDEIKKNLSPFEGPLDIKDACGNQRRYVATLTNGDQIFAQRQGYHITICPFVFQFTAFGPPFGESVDFNLQNVFDNSNLDFNYELQNPGTYKTTPQIVMIFTAASGVTDLTFTNSTNGKAIKITTAISPLDIIEIDCVNQIVRRNSAVIDYDGVFPDFNIGQNFYNISITGAAATYTLTIKYKTTYL
jgi:hypothetical protein